MSRRVKLRDYEIRGALALRLKEQFPEESGSLIIDEFGCRSSRVDVAVVNGQLHGYEIKSECDTLTRLKTQAPTFNSIFDRMTIVAALKHVGRLSEYIPPWWGILEATPDESGKPRLRCVRRGKPNGSQDPLTLARMLWRQESYAVLRSRGMADGLRRASADKLARLVADRIRVSEIADEVRAAIKARGGTGFAGRRTRSGGTCTTEPIASHYQSNLDWLLSSQSHGPRH